VKLSEPVRNLQAPAMRRRNRNSRDRWFNRRSAVCAARVLSIFPLQSPSIAPLRRGFSLFATRTTVLLLLLLCRCSLFGSTTGTDGAFSGSSTPRASREPGSVVGGVFVGAGGGGVNEAEDLAHSNCEQYHLKAEVGGATNVNGAVSLRYTCQ
jgi:hypothetical protein